MNATGSCVCGAIQYQLDSALVDCSYCHCSICRKLTGSAFAAYGAVKKTDFKWIKGETQLLRFMQTKNTERGFCGKCGAFLVTDYKPEPNTLHISLGSLNEGPKIQIEYHQYYGSKASWCVVDDNLSKYDGWPDEA